MYAIISTSGRQIKVQEGQVVTIDLTSADQGDSIQFDRVLAVSDDTGLKFGAPLLDGATVTGEVLGPIKGPKLTVQKLRRRKNSRRRTGHRQLYTSVRIDKISV